MTDAPPKVFISYSHDTVEHQERVLGLADRLRADGVDAEVDQYNAAPPEGWPLWCERQIEAADVVLMVCTETYHRRVSGDEDRGKGLGVVWEARIIRQIVYDAGAVSDKFVPVLFSDASPEHIPRPIKGSSWYVVDTTDGYEALYRHLTQQPGVVRPALGELLPLPAKHRCPQTQAELADTHPFRRSLKILGMTLDIITRKATLVSIGQPMPKPSPQVSSSQPPMPRNVSTRLWFKFDDQEEWALDLTNMAPPGREGTRFTILFVIGKKGSAFVFSAYNHAASSWINLNKFRALFWHVLANWLTLWEIIIGSILMLAFMIASVNHLYVKYLILCGCLFGASMLILNFVRCASLWRFLHDAREKSVQQLS